MYVDHAEDEEPKDALVSGTNGPTNLAKILCRKENKELIETIERYTDGLVISDAQCRRLWKR